MKIISSHKDYYDSCMHTVGIDEHIKYIRENVKIEITDLDLKELYLPNTSTFFFRLDTKYYFNILGIAGKLYPILIIREYNKPAKHIYDIDEIKKQFDNCFKDRWWHNFDKFISQLNNSVILNIFYKYNTATFLLSVNVERISLELEPILKDLETFKILHTYTIYQELSMFISERLNNEINGSTLTDKEKIISKGFDLKKSFRKEKKDSK